MRIRYTAGCYSTPIADIESVFEGDTGRVPLFLLLIIEESRVKIKKLLDLT